MRLNKPTRALTPATNLVVGDIYTIANLGTTNFTLVGAASNAVGVTFTATGTGTGTGNAFLNSRKTVKIHG